VIAGWCLYESESADALVVGNGGLDIGTIGWQRDYKKQLPITNRTDKDITITRFQRSCDCVSIDPESPTIPARSTRTVTLSLNLSPRPLESSSGPSPYRWPYSVSVIPELDSATEDSLQGRIVWTLHGEVQIPWILSPATLDFGNELTNETDRSSQLVRVVCEHPVAHLDASCDERLATVIIEEGDNERSCYLLRVTPQPTLPLGRHDFNVELTGVSSDGKQLASPPIHVKARVKGAVEIIPESVAFGAKPFGETVSMDLLLCATTERHFQLKTVRGDSSDLRVDEADAKNENAATLKHVLRVSQRISEMGQHSNDVVFVIGIANSNDVQEITVPVSYFGINNLGP